MDEPPLGPDGVSPDPGGVAPAGWRASGGDGGATEPVPGEGALHPARRDGASGLAAYRARRRAAKAARSKLRRRLTRAGISFVALVVILAGGVTGYGAYRFGQITKIPGGKGLTAPPGTGNPENILLIGSTNRCAATQIAVFRQECAQGVNGINSDVVMVVRIVPATHHLTLLSFPRDTFVPDARSGGLSNRIDAALADGPSQLAEAISQDFGIPINHFVELDFSSFENVVNVLGGISMYFPQRLYDAENPPLDIMRTGCVHLNGNVALALVRSRHLYHFTKGQHPNFAAIQAATASGADYTPNSGGSYDGTGDLGRIVRVHAFLRVLASNVAKRGLGNVLTDNALIGAVAPDLAVDNTFGNAELLHLALDLHGADLGTAPEYTAPIVVDASTYYYKGYSYGDVVFPSEPQDQAAINTFLGSTPPGLALPAPSISVSVVDGTGSSASAAATAAQLQALGYKMVPTTATDYVGPVSETTVVYAKGHLQQAERVMSSLSGTVVMGQGTPAAGADISVIAGSDLTVAAPGRAVSTTTTSAPTATSTPGSSTTTSGATTTAPASTVPASTVPASTAPASTVPVTAVPASSTTTTTNPNFSLPTAARTALAPWDPRACPAKP